jgi:hypothetical protein
MRIHELLSNKVRAKARIEIFYQMPSIPLMHGLGTAVSRTNQAIAFQMEEDLEDVRHKE